MQDGATLNGAQEKGDVEDDEEASLGELPEPLKSSSSEHSFMRQLREQSRDALTPVTAAVVSMLLLFAPMRFFQHALRHARQHAAEGLLLLPTLAAGMLTGKRRAFAVLLCVPLLPSAVRWTLRMAHFMLATARGVLAKQKPRERVEYSDSLLSAPQRPLEFASCVLVLLWAFQTLVSVKLFKAWAGYVMMARSLCVQLACAWTALNLIHSVEERSIAARAQRAVKKALSGTPGAPAFTGTTSQDESLAQARVNALAKLASILVGLCASLTSLSTVGVDVKAVAAFSGVGGVVLGLAGREMLANYIGGITIYLSQPFSIGDWIHSKDKSLDGWVEHIGWYYTKVITWDKRPMYVPNSKFYTMTILNASRMSNRRILQTLRLRLQDMSRVPAIVRDIKQVLLTHEALDPRQHRLVFFRDIGEYSLDIWVSCFTRSVFLTDYLSAQQEILFAIDAILQSHGARFASANAREQLLIVPDADRGVSTMRLSSSAAQAAEDMAAAPPPGFLSADAARAADDLQGGLREGWRGAASPAPSYAAAASAAAAAAARIAADMTGPTADLAAEEVATLHERQAELEARQEELEARLRSISLREGSLDDKELAMDQMQQALTRQEIALKEQETALRVAERAAAQREFAIAAREAAAQGREKQHGKRGGVDGVDGRRGRSSARDEIEALSARAAKSQATSLRLKEAATLRKARFVERRAEAVEAKTAALGQKEAALKLQEEALEIEKESVQNVKLQVLEEVQAVVQELTLQAASAQLQTQQADYEAAFAKLKSAGPAEGEVGSVVAAKSGNATAGGAAPAVEATSVGEAVAAAVASVAPEMGEAAVIGDVDGESDAVYIEEYERTQMGD